MKFDPQAGDLWNDDGKLVKRVSCPLMLEQPFLEARTCQHCNRKVTPITDMSEVEVTDFLTHDPTACIELRINAPNVKVVTK